MQRTYTIVIVSDNHGQLRPLIDIRNQNSTADYFFHLGDSELLASELDGYACVRGNNDYYGDFPESLVLHVAGHHFYLVHGNSRLFFGEYESLAVKAKALGCDTVCFGHTHLYTDITVQGIRLLNPGSLAYNRDQSKPSYMKLIIQGETMQAIRMTYQPEPVTVERKHLFRRK